MPAPNRRIHNHKVFKAGAQRGKTSMGNDQIKNIQQIEPARYYSVVNTMVNVLYQIAFIDIHDKLPVVMFYARMLRCLYAPRFRKAPMRC